MAGNLVISQINGGPIGVINAIINGNYQINQRGVSGTVTLTAGNYGHDRWKAGSGGCVYTFATVNDVTTLTITAGTLVQVIEGSNLYSGTYVLSFTGTAQGKIGAGSFAASGVTGTAVGGTNLNIEFNTGTVSLVQFEPGSEVSPFERRDIGRELMMCQRYYETGQIGCYGYNTTNQAIGAERGFLATKRGSPTIAYSSSTLSNITGSIASQVITVDGVLSIAAIASTGAGSFYAVYTSSAEL